jgi:hypothetical protein
LSWLHSTHAPTRSSAHSTPAAHDPLPCWAQGRQSHYRRLPDRPAALSRTASAASQFDLRACRDACRPSSSPPHPPRHDRPDCERVSRCTARHCIACTALLLLSPPRVPRRTHCQAHQPSHSLRRFEDPASSRRQYSPSDARLLCSRCGRFGQSGA